ATNRSRARLRSPLQRHPRTSDVRRLPDVTPSVAGVTLRLTRGKGAAMRTSHPERRTPTFRQFALVLAAVTWFALLLPVGARATGQLVTLVDPTSSNKAVVDATGALRVAEYNVPGRALLMKKVDVGIAPGMHSSDPATLIAVSSRMRLVIDTI